MSRIFIVDTENTNNYKFLSDFKVSVHDSVYLVFNEKSKKVEWNFMRDLFNLECNVEFIEVKHTGIPSGFDFQLSTLLGSLVSTFNKMITGYYIVSKDKGFLANKGMLEALYPDILFGLIIPEESICKEETKTSVISADIKIDRVEYVNFINTSHMISSRHRSSLIDVCDKCKSKSDLHNRLTALLPNGSNLYGLLKNRVFA